MMSDAPQKGSGLHYHASREDVRVGDRVRWRRWFGLGKYEHGTVAYIPGISPKHRELGNDTWAIRSDDGKTVWAMPYAPAIGQPKKTLELLCRGVEGEIRPDERIDEDQVDESEEA